ncbi:MAG: Uma2 family endonuclease [Saprospiraceae bacterium]|nr:Uma2 family endonuclease [Saprospiraceae bacterium]
MLSPCTASKDRGIKKTEYAAHGIREFWIIDPDREQVELYFLLENTTVYFEPYVLTRDEIIESQVLSGFSIPVCALFYADVNMQALQALLPGK